MTRNQLFLLLGFMVCLTGAVICVVIYSQKSLQRSIYNINTLCETFEQVTGEKCKLDRPTPGITEQPSPSKFHTT